MGVIAEIVQSDYEIIYNCKSTHNRTSPLATEIQKMGCCRAFSVQGLTGAGLPTALYEKSPAQSAELQFVCGERGTLFW